MKRWLCIVAFCLCVGLTPAWALEIYLKNGDKITGTVLHEDDQYIHVKTEAAGEITLKKSLIDLLKTYPAAGPCGLRWKKDFSLGYTQAAGNTKSQLGQIATTLDGKTDRDEVTVTYNAYYSSSNGLMNGKKFYGLLRYAHSYGPNLKWYNFYKMEGEQDYFADIVYRLTPTIGTGYWFSNTPDFKLMSEVGLGFQYTDYRAATSSNGGTPILVPRFFVDKRLFANVHLTEDFSIYPSLENIHDYHIRSETDLINQFSKQWSCKISYTDEFNSLPPSGTKKNDYTWITSLEYHF